MKLLRKTVTSYIIYAFAIMLIAVPVFYLLISNMLSRDIDIRLISQKAKILERLGTLTKVTDISSIEPDALVALSNDPRQYDTLYTIKLHDTRISRTIPYRVLQANVTVKNIRYKVQLQNSLVESDELIKNIVLVQFILMVLIALGLLLINRKLSKVLWLPFYLTLKKLKSYKIESEQQLDFESTGIDEFNFLNKTLSALTKRNVDVYQSQQEFTENAAHEMQSPLAVSQSKIELLMQTTPISDEQAELISELSDAGNRMNRLNKSLLLLSKIDNNQFPEKESIDAVEVMNKILKQYQNTITQKRILLNVAGTNPVILSINKTLLEVLFSNLISNALRHNVPGGTLYISINETQFIIQNSGPFSSLDTGKLFRRFQKQTAEQNSLGLGLQIAQKICNLNGFLIRYTFEKSKHVFVVQF